MATLTLLRPDQSKAGTDEPVYYFAYGSNSPSQLAERLGHHVKSLGKARLPGYRFVYMGRSVKWGSATANVIAVGQYQFSEVWGVLYELTKSDISRLDDFEGVKLGEDNEGHQIGRYFRIEEQILLSDRYLSAYLYVLTGHLSIDRELRPPSRAYLLSVIEMALTHGFPRDYIERVLMPTICWDSEIIRPG